MLKSIKAIFIAALIAQTAIAQDETPKQTLLSGKIKKIGIIGSLSGQYTSLNGGFNPAGGGSISLLFNEKLAVGLAGYGIHTPNNSTSALRTNGGVGGLQVEYITNPSKLVHFSFPLLIGMGMASSDSSSRSNDFFGGRGGHGRNNRFEWGYRGNGTSFAVVQPGVNVEVNVFKFVSVFAGANYRIALNSNSTTLTNSKLSGLGFQVGLKGGFSGFSLARLKK